MLIEMFSRPFTEQLISMGLTKNEIGIAKFRFAVFWSFFWLSATALFQYLGFHQVISVIIGMLPYFLAGIFVVLILRIRYGMLIYVASETFTFIDVLKISFFAYTIDTIILGIITFTPIYPQIPIFPIDVTTFIVLYLIGFLLTLPIMIILFLLSFGVIYTVDKILVLSATESVASD